MSTESVRAVRSAATITIKISAASEGEKEWAHLVVEDDCLESVRVEKMHFAHKVGGIDSVG